MPKGDTVRRNARLPADFRTLSAVFPLYRVKRRTERAGPSKACPLCLWEPNPGKEPAEKYCTPSSLAIDSCGIVIFFCQCQQKSVMTASHFMIQYCEKKGMPMQSNDIKKILALVKEKNPSGFDLLYQHYFRFLFSVAYSVLNSEKDSYDVIQSVMMRLYQLDQNLFPSSHELSWLRTVVKNEALMYLRREKSTAPLEETADFPVLDQKIENFVDMDAIYQLIAPLNERQKKVVSMKILGDMAHKEIAQMLSVPIGTVQWIYATSIKKLRRSLTALASLTLIFGGGFGYQLVQYLQAPSEVPGDVGISSIPAVKPVISPWLILLLVLFLSAAAVCILFFKFSDQIPTKRLTSRIQ